MFTLNMEDGATDERTNIYETPSGEYNIHYKIKIFKDSGEEPKPPPLKNFDESSSGQPSQSPNPPPLKQFVP